MITAAFCTDVGYYLGGGGAPESYYLGPTRAGGMKEPAGLWSGEAAREVLAELLADAGVEVPEGYLGTVDADTMHHLFDTFTALDGTPLGNAPARRQGPAAETVERRMTEWLAEHPDALPEDARRARGRFERTRKTVLGVDLTANLPKSFTIALTALKRMELQALRDGDEDGAELWARLHADLETDLYEANAEALRVVSTKALAQVQDEGKGRAAKLIRAPKLIAASFLQHTSRSIDPHVHIHNVLLNRAQCSDGKWRALDGTSLLDYRGEFSAIFDRVLAEKWAARGLRSALRGDGVTRELVDVTDGHRELFSSRSVVISGRLAEEVEKAEAAYGRELTGLEVWRIKRDLTLKTRDAKTHDGESEEELYARWQREASEAVGDGLEPLAQVLRTRMEAGRPVEAETFSAHAVCSSAVAACAAVRASWRPADLMREIELRLPVLGGLQPEEVTELLQMLTEDTLRSDLVVQTAGQAGVAVPVELLQHGETYDRPTARLYAAVGTVMAEESLRRAAVERGRFCLDAGEVDRWLEEKGQDLSVDQAEVVRGLATSDAGMVSLVGPAGAGKTYALAAFGRMWQDLSGGGRVHGITTSEKAAQVLAAEGLPLTLNARRWLDTQARIAGPKRTSREDLRYVLSERDVVVVDEASMISTADLTEVQEVLQRTGARPMLTGDPRQLGAVQAGGVMGLVEDRADVFTLTEVRRFTAEWEGPASLRLRDGEAEVLQEYDRQGRILQADGVPAALQSAAKAAAADIMTGKQTLVVASSNEQAARVAALVREELLEAGYLRPEDGGEAEIRSGQGVGRDDQVMGRLNDHAAGLVNRGVYTVADVRGDGGLTVVDAHGVMLQVSPEYVAEHLDSAFGSTVHAAQGATVDTCHLVTDGRLDAAALYVALTRGKERNTAHVAVEREEEAPDSRPQAATAIGEEPQLTTDGGQKSKVVQTFSKDPKASARQVLTDALARSGEAAAASVERERDDARVAGMSHLLGRREDAVRTACRGRLDRWLDELCMADVLPVEVRCLLRTDQGTEHVSRLLRAVEQSGQDPRAVLERAVKFRGFSGARSCAQVISGRITSYYRLNSAKSKVAVAEPKEDAAVPAGLTRGVTGYLQELQERTEDRRRVLGAEVAEAAPEWAVLHLGPVPEEPVERLEWEDRAGKVAGYREATGWDHPLRAIGDAPGITSTERRADWHVAWTALGRPAEQRAEATMTEGQLQVRRDAWSREQTWAPEYGDDALKAAELDAFRARRDALLATDEKEAARLWEVHEERAAVAEAMQVQVSARDAWVAETATMRALGERAEAELKERGVPEAGQEEDRMTAAEWLAQHRAEEAAEDPHREWSDTDEEAAALAVDLAAGVEERSGDLSSTELPQPRTAPGRAQAYAETHPDAAHLEALRWEAAAVHARIEDRTSQEEASSDRAYVEPYDTADGYYVPAAQAREDALVDE